MHREKQIHVPAAAPLAGLICGLTAAPHLVNPMASATAAASIAALALALARRRWSVPACILVSCVAIGLFLGTRRHELVRDLGQRVTSAEGHFTTIEAPIRHGWAEGESGAWVLRVDRFVIAAEGARPDFDVPLTLYLHAEPAADQGWSGIVAEGFLGRSERGRFSLSIKSARLVEYRGRSSAWAPSQWNRQLESAVDSLVEGDPELTRAAALAKALALGRSDALPDELRESYRRGGTYHFLVFSGMQIALTAAFLMWLCRLAGLSAAGDWILLAIAVLAPPFAGNEPSVTRASWMIGLYAVSRLLRRPTPTENLLFVAAFLRLALVPEEVSDAGFALTYAATAGLILVGKPLDAALRSRRFPFPSIAYGIGAELATTPLTLFYFHQYVLGSSLVTLLLSPLLVAMFAASVLACTLAGISPLLAETVLRCIADLDRLCSGINAFVADSLHLSGMAAAPPGASLVIVWVVFVATVVIWRRRRATLLAAALFLLPPAISLFVMMARQSVAVPQVVALDVGQGDAILLRQKERTVLVDGGGRRSDRRFGRSVLIPMLVDRGVRRIDVAVLSHPHPDHCVGLIGVIENLRVGELWISPKHLRDACAIELLDRADSHDVPVRFMRGGEVLHAGDIEIETISSDFRFKRAKLNNSSLVLRARMAGVRILLTGDIEREAERTLLEDERGHLRAEILKVAHHGSRSSTTAAFLDAVAPRLAIVSCGRRNPFGHPASSVLELLTGRGIRTGRTDLGGTITIECRDDGPRLWAEIDTP